MGDQSNYKRFRLDLYLNEQNPVDAEICKYLLAFKAGRVRNAEVRAALALYVATLSPDDKSVIPVPEPVPEHPFRSSDMDMTLVYQKMEDLTQQIEQIKEQMKQPPIIDPTERMKVAEVNHPSEQIEHISHISDTVVPAGTNTFPADPVSIHSEQKEPISVDKEQPIMSISDDVLEYVQSL